MSSVNDLNRTEFLNGLLLDNNINRQLRRSDAEFLNNILTKQKDAKEREYQKEQLKEQQKNQLADKRKAPSLIQPRNIGPSSIEDAYAALEASKGGKKGEEDKEPGLFDKIVGNVPTTPSGEVIKGNPMRALSTASNGGVAFPTSHNYSDEDNNIYYESIIGVSNNERDSEKIEKARNTVFTSLSEAPNQNGKSYLGIRFNNPLNLRHNNEYIRRGQIGYYQSPTNGQFAAFQDERDGIDAVFNILRGKSYLGGNANTLRKVIERFAPRSDKNNTDAYVNNVARKSGLNPDDVIGVNDIDKIVAMMNAMAISETSTDISGYTKHYLNHYRKKQFGGDIPKMQAGAIPGDPPYYDQMRNGYYGTTAQYYAELGDKMKDNPDLLKGYDYYKSSLGFGIPSRYERERGLKNAHDFDNWMQDMRKKSPDFDFVYHFTPFAAFDEYQKNHQNILDGKDVVKNSFDMAVNLITMVPGLKLAKAPKIIRNFGKGVRALDNYNDLENADNSPYAPTEPNPFYVPPMGVDPKRFNKKKTYDAVMENGEIVNQDGQSAIVVGKHHENLGDNIYNNGEVDGESIRLFPSFEETIANNSNLIPMNRRRRTNKYLFDLDNIGIGFVTPSTVNKKGLMDNVSRDGTLLNAKRKNIMNKLH